VADGFNRIHVEEIVSFTVLANVRSTRVMERLSADVDAVDLAAPDVVVEDHLAAVAGRR